MTAFIKRLSLADMDQVAVIYRASFDERLPWLAGLHTLDEDRAYYRNHVFTKCEVWGADQGDALAGFVAFREGWIHQFYVLPNQQRRGLGSALLQLAKSASSSLSLWTFQRNMLARRFYEARGFVVIKMTDGTDNEELEPDVLYRWDNRMPLSSDLAL